MGNAGYPVPWVGGMPYPLANTPFPTCDVMPNLTAVEQTLHPPEKWVPGQGRSQRGAGGLGPP